MTQEFVAMVIVAVDTRAPIETIQVPTVGTIAAVRELLGGEFISFNVPDARPEVKRHGVMLMNRNAVQDCEVNVRASAFAVDMGMVGSSSSYRIHGDVVFCSEPVVGMYQGCPIMLISHLVASAIQEEAFSTALTDY